MFSVHCSLTNKNNATNAVVLTLKANVKELTESAPKRCPLELFEDDSELNVLITNRDEKEDFFYMDFGDCFTGVKKVVVFNVLCTHCIDLGMFCRLRDAGFEI